MMMLGTYDRKFDILITQIPCKSDQRGKPIGTGTCNLTHFRN